MAKTPFNIKYRPQIESGEYKVVIYMGNNPTEGCPVEILKWDSNSDAGCIIGCFRVKGKDKLYVFDENGEHKVSGIRDNRLFIITPEPELTEFERAIEGYIKSYTGIVQTDVAAKLWSAELLDLARTELTCQGNIILSIGEFEKRYIEAEEKGRKEALKDLPRWKKHSIIDNSDFYLQFHDRVLGKRDGIIIYDGYEIRLSDLKKLPKED